MLTCGTYDAAGEFAYWVGLPGKSGVGGGIIAVAPNNSTICVWGVPGGLDAQAIPWLASPPWISSPPGPAYPFSESV
jgi:glutaminase